MSHIALEEETVVIMVRVMERNMILQCVHLATTLTLVKDVSDGVLMEVWLTPLTIAL
jgi:hypothetical protein